jgi:hypothetical protein
VRTWILKVATDVHEVAIASKSNCDHWLKANPGDLFFRLEDDWLIKNGALATPRPLPPRARTPAVPSTDNSPPVPGAGNQTSCVMTVDATASPHESGAPDDPIGEHTAKPRTDTADA